MKRGICVMQMTAMLFLLMSLTAAMPFQHKHRPGTNTLSIEHRVLMLNNVPLIDQVVDTHPTVTHSEMENAPIHQSASDKLLQSIFMQSKNAQGRIRRKRTPSKGCQFGTCQMHNLADTLYRMGQTTNKEQSKGVGDPNGYGR